MSHPPIFKERRASNDRRQFSYAAHCPERRSGKDRRAMQNKETDQRVA
ncbi:hypothetical protein [Desulfospira joergensenii]|nr:hypothetical protein [Desulfospira joergensenii]